MIRDTRTSHDAVVVTHSLKCAGMFGTVDYANSIKASGREPASKGRTHDRFHRSIIKTKKVLPIRGRPHMTALGGVVVNSFRLPDKLI